MQLNIMEALNKKKIGPHPDGLIYPCQIQEVIAQNDRMNTLNGAIKALLTL